MSQIQVISSGLENIEFIKNNGTTYTFNSEYLKDKRKIMGLDNVVKQRDNTLNVGFILLKQGNVKNDLLLIDLDRDIGQALFNTSYAISYSDVARLGLVFYLTAADQTAALNPFYWDTFLLRNGNEALFRYTNIASLTDINCKIVVDEFTKDNYVDKLLSTLTTAAYSAEIKTFNMQTQIDTIQTGLTNVRSKVDVMNFTVENPPYLSLGNSAVYVAGSAAMADNLNFRYSMYNRIDSDKYFEFISDTVLEMSDWKDSAARFVDNFLNFGHNNGYYPSPNGNITSFKPQKNSGSIILEKSGRYLINVKWGVAGMGGFLGKNILYGSTHIFVNNKDLNMNNTDGDMWVYPKQYATFSATKILQAYEGDVLRVCAFIKSDHTETGWPFFWDASKQLLQIHFLGT